MKTLRVVNIEAWDIEACGGTHCSATGEVGFIKITKSERIQDGIDRLEYVAGEAAVKYVERHENILLELTGRLATPIDKVAASVANIQRELEVARKSSKNLSKKLADSMVDKISGLASQVAKDVKLYVSSFEEGLDSEYQLLLGDKISRVYPSLVYIALFEENSRTRLMVFCGQEAQARGAKAGAIAREIAKSIGGSGGGDSRFAQGGADGRPASLPDFNAILLNQIQQ